MYALNDRAAAINMCTVARNSLSKAGSHGTGSSTEANQTCDGYLGCPHKNYELFDDNTFTDDYCALAVLAGTSTSLTSGQHDPNNFGGGDPKRPTNSTTRTAFCSPTSQQRPRCA